MDKTPPALPDGWDVSWVPAAIRKADGTPGRVSEMVVYGNRRSLDWTVPARVVVKLQLPESPTDFDQLTFTERKETQRDPVKQVAFASDKNPCRNLHKL